MHKPLASLSICVCALLTLSACFLTKYSRRDRFVSQVMISSQKLDQASQQRLIGKPAPDKAEGAVKLAPGVQVVVKVALPTTYQGYCEALSIHLPKGAQHEADYQVWISGSSSGPWEPVGRAVSDARFNIDDIPFSQAHFVRIKVHPSSGHPLYLDAVRIRVHLPRWQPPLKRTLPQQSPKVRKRSLKHADGLIQKGHSFFEQQKYKEALASYLEALPWRRKHAGLAYGIAATYYALSQHFQALRHYRRAFRLKAPSKFQREEYGQSYYAMRLLPQAHAAFQRCIAAAPLYPRCYYHRLSTASRYESDRKLLLGMYRDAYRIVRLRTHIKYRRWSRARILALARRGRRMWELVRSPWRLPLHAHLDWYMLQHRLFPKERKAAGRQSVRLLLKFAEKKQDLSSDALIYKGIISYKMGDVRGGIQALKDAMLSAKGSRKAMIRALQRGLKLERAGKTSQALALYHAVQRKHHIPLLRHYLEQFP